MAVRKRPEPDASQTAPRDKSKVDIPFFFSAVPEVLFHASILKLLGLKSLDRDVLGVLLIHHRKDGQPRGWADMADETIADILAVKRESISRSLKRLTKAGLIRRDKALWRSKNHTCRRVVLLFWDDPKILPNLPGGGAAARNLKIIGGDGPSDSRGPEATPQGEDTCNPGVTSGVTPGLQMPVTEGLHRPDCISQTKPDAPFAALRSQVPGCGSQRAAYRPRRWAADLEQKATIAAGGLLVVEGCDDASVERMLKSIGRIAKDPNGDDRLALGNLLARVGPVNLADAVKEAVRRKKQLTGDPLDYLGRIARINHDKGARAVERRRARAAQAFDEELEDGNGKPNVFSGDDDPLDEADDLEYPTV